MSDTKDYRAHALRIRDTAQRCLDNTSCDPCTGPCIIDIFHEPGLAISDRAHIILALTHLNDKEDSNESE